MRRLNRLAGLGTVLLALTLVLPRVGAAQTKYFGIVGGATLSDMSDSYGAYSTASKWGGNAGLILGVLTSRRMAVSLEPAWTQMGAKVGDVDGGIDYFEVPLTVGGLAESPNEKLRYGGYAGIMPAFKLSCSIEQPADACERVNGTGWFLPLGLRFLSSTGKGSFVGLDFRYSIPLSSTFDNATVKQRSWAFRLIFVKGAL